MRCSARVASFFIILYDGICYAYCTNKQITTLACWNFIVEKSFSNFSCMAYAMVGKLITCIIHTNPRTAIEAVSFLTLEYNKRGFWSGSGKTPPEQSSSGKKIQAESAVAARQSAINIKREESRKNNY